MHSVLNRVTLLAIKRYIGWVASWYVARKIGIHVLYLNFAFKIWTLLRARVAQYPSILTVFAEASVSRNIDAFAIYSHRKNEQEVHRSSKFALDDLGIPLRRNVVLEKISSLCYQEFWFEFQFVQKNFVFVSILYIFRQQIVGKIRHFVALLKI